YLAYNPFYNKLHDPLYVIGHVLNDLQYTCMLMGLFISMASIFRSEGENAARLRTAQDEPGGTSTGPNHRSSQTNQALQEEIIERRRAEHAAEAASRAK